MVSYILVTFELGLVKIEHFYLKLADFELFILKGQNAPMEFKLGKIRGNRIVLLLENEIFLPEKFIFMRKVIK